jgi:hypothetical protein
MAERVGGIIFLKVNGQQYRCKGSFTFDLGAPQRTAVVGHDGPHGYNEVPKTPFIEGEITDSSQISLEELLNFKDATVTLELANGKVIALREAWYAGDGQGQTEEGNVTFRAEGLRGEEVR